MKTSNRIRFGMAAIALAFAANVFAADPNNGASIYQRHCFNCHGDTGFGVMPGAPDFTRGERLFAPDSDLADSIRNGIRVMPGFNGILTDQEILDVIAYLRTLQ